MPSGYSLEANAGAAIEVRFSVVHNESFVNEHAVKTLKQDGESKTRTMSRECHQKLQKVVQCSGHPHTKACPPTPNRLFPVPPGSEVGYGCANKT